MYNKTKKRDPKKTFLVKQVAAKNNISKRSIERMIEGTQNNDEVLADYDDLKEAVDKVIEAYQSNRLLEAVKELVPF